MRINKMRLFLLITLVLSNIVIGDEKEFVLEIINSKASELTKQDVRFNDYTFNMTGNWALAFGVLKPTLTEKIDWAQLKQCNNPEDKNFWAVLNKTNEKWEFVQLHVCASEPPYWYLEEEIGLVWPCELYRDLKADPEVTLYEKCIQSR